MKKHDCGNLTSKRTEASKSARARPLCPYNAQRTRIIRRRTDMLPAVTRGLGNGPTEAGGGDPNFDSQAKRAS